MWLYIFSILFLSTAVVSFTIVTLYASGKLLIKDKTYRLFLFLSGFSAMIAGNLISQMIKTLI
jgi:hypothetical protein